MIALLGERLQKLKSLAQKIKAAQEACVALDLEALRAHDSQKSYLCAEISRLDIEISRIVLKHDPAGSLRAILVAGYGSESRTEPAARLLNGLFEESESARAEVRRLNRVYAQFLARSRNTLNVMINVVSHCLGVYPFLDRPASLTLPFERGY